MLVYAFRSVLRSTTCGIPKPDIVVGSSVHLLAAIAGLRLARRYGVPFIFEVRDLWPQTLIDIGNLKPERPVTRILQSMEKWIYRNSDKIVTLLPYAVDYIVSLGINNKQIEWIPNGVDLASFPEPPPPPQRETFTLMYFGAHGNANGLESILEAMSRLQDRKPEPKIHLRLVGDGFQKPALMQKAQKMGLRNVSFEAPVQKSFIPVLAGDADAFVFSLVKAPVFRYGISPNKLFDFMASARPIIFYSDAMNNPVRDAGAGLTVMPEDPEALAEAMIKLQSTPLHLRHEMGRAGRRYIEEHHDFRKLAQKFAKILYELQETHKNRSNKAVL